MGFGVKALWRRAQGLGLRAQGLTCRRVEGEKAVLHLDAHQQVARDVALAHLVCVCVCVCVFFVCVFVYVCVCVCVCVCEEVECE